MPDPGTGPLQIDFQPAAARARLLDDPRTLVVFGFGATPDPHPDPRWLHLPLEQAGPPMLEVWRSPREVTCATDGALRQAGDGQLQFTSLVVEEDPADLAASVARAYAQLAARVAAGPYPHLLRTWNYLDAITAGEGDDERYRRFCVGRARGLGQGLDERALPAATCIGRYDGRRVIQLAALSARHPGRPVENPRQLSAWRYPRQYGPQAPSFARAMLPPPGLPMPLLLSGTAAIVGHASRHADSVQDQVDEILANLDSLVASARQHMPHLPATLGRGSPLKVYVRDRADMAAVQARLAARLDPGVPRLMLLAEVCRRELRVEIDGVHAPAGAG